ncbi:TonB C-terminal domain-containing protein [Acinetobacter pittii]|uniref:TonB C-terminal domain-containing protein n=1 Tax=Acinetobacter TaxID=469 RepID=UPI0007081059|nr:MULTISPECIES: TonB C-terminal domain-containing protein [Acinetobacter]AVZ04522.1 TonB C-terminal domain-containing protein [Acinetobacter pittii]KQE13802.1 energy transducer TonB [Acinetobacter pittii]MBN6509936.1 TonB C-terminal domain-containing protein [Acinetobacter pittii]MBT1524875.1 TonB C-terminal domain-containing protein [Acinetobacter pittii]MCH2014017.1 TonB C-terminal domain-containing protein [Acinetobacter pittii]
MKNFTIVASLFLLVGCATGHKQVTPAPVVDNKIISEAEKYKKQYQKKIYKTWDIPKSSTGMSTSVKVFLTDTGEIEQIIFLDKEEQKFKTSIEKAIWRSSPFVLPSNPEVRKQARKFNIKFQVK